MAYSLQFFVVKYPLHFMKKKHCTHNIVESNSNLLEFPIVLKTRATNDDISVQNKEKIKVSITAIPIQGKANTHLISFLSKKFGVNKTHISITKGKFNRYKKIKIINPKLIPKCIKILMKNNKI